MGRTMSSKSFGRDRTEFDVPLRRLADAASIASSWFSGAILIERDCPDAAARDRACGCGFNPFSRVRHGTSLRAMASHIQFIEDEPSSVSRTF
jgi:hypothetical protein